jgi:nicotinate-nucleotide adenylyltransferase
MRAYAAYGGTFDPVHRGHVAVAQAVRACLGVDVHLLPAADPPHKDSTHADARHRLRMLQLAVADQPGLHVDPRELQRDGPSYTVDTLAGLRGELGPDVPLIWVVGADSLAQLHRWHRWTSLFELGHVLALGRGGHALDLRDVAAELRAHLAPRLVAPKQLRDRPAGSLAVLDLQPLRPESSTEIRRRIASGARWETWVAPAVAAYIVRHRLYAPGAAA